MAEEGLKKTKNDLIHIGCPIPFDVEEFLEELDGLLEAAYKNRDDMKERVERGNNKMYDYLVVGAGLYGAVFAHEAKAAGKDEDGNDLPKTVISREYSSEWKPGDEPYYPVNDEKNSNLYSEYKKLADAEKKVIFGGRLGEYKYYDIRKYLFRE